MFEEIEIKQGVFRQLDELARDGAIPASNTPYLDLKFEAVLLLAEGVAERPSDVDVVMANGYGFPRRQGAPVYWALPCDPAKLQRELDSLANVSGPGFIRG